MENLLQLKTLYVGPKLPKQLAEIEENLDLTDDYGFLVVGQAYVVVGSGS